jgi:hypothetical protein
MGKEREKVKLVGFTPPLHSLTQGEGEGQAAIFE